MERRSKLNCPKLTTVLFHFCGGTLISVVLALWIMPPHLWSELWSAAQHADVAVFTLESVFFHLLISFSFWTFLTLAISALRAPKTVKIVRAKGSVMVETLIVLPVFLLITFGMGQLSINNVAGILANVAVYQSARAAWVWMPEEQASQKRMGVTEGLAKQKARSAAAMVMLPVAPGDHFLGTLDGGEVAQKAREAAVGSHGLGNVLPEGAIAQDTDLMSGKTYVRALGAQSFVRRTASKFSMAYNATEVAIDEDSYEVTLTYSHFQSMPLVGRIFGQKKWFGPTLQPGFYSEIKLTYGFEKQVNVPNAKLPATAVYPSIPDITDFYSGFEIQ